MFKGGSSVTWQYSPRATFSHDWWWSECAADPNCGLRRDGYWTNFEGIDKFKLVTGSLLFPCKVAKNGDIPFVDRSKWPVAQVIQEVPLTTTIAAATDDTEVVEPTVEITEPETETDNEQNSSTPGWAIALLVMGSLLVVSLFVVLGVLVKRRM